MEHREDPWFVAPRGQETLVGRVQPGLGISHGQRRAARVSMAAENMCSVGDKYL
jgi:hypothetical protein